VEFVDRPADANRLTEHEREAFARDGFFVIRRALDDVRLERLRAIAQEHDAAYRQSDGVTKYHLLNEHDLIGKEPEWVDMIDLPTTFPKVFGIMGWNIQLFHTQLIVTPPAPGAGPGPYGWHQDNNRMNRDLDTDFQPMISLKVGYFLSDMSATGMGNLVVLPGSHLLPMIEDEPARPRGDLDAAELVADAGDAVVFDRRLWHSASTNLSSTTRIFTAFGYSYRWLRPKSKMPATDSIAGLDPIRRQLLGSATSANGYFDPLPEDVPLRQWIRPQ
jgi:ectoine hydroxylase